MALVPLFKATLTVTPALRPYSALILLVWTLNSTMASGAGCATWLEKPWLLIAYELLSTPSSIKLLTDDRRPFTLNEPSRGDVESAMSDLRTPAVSHARSE